LKKKLLSTPQRIGLEVECTGELKAIFETVLGYLSGLFGVFWEEKPELINLVMQSL
jgi:hypothetical protein